MRLPLFSLPLVVFRYFPLVGFFPLGQCTSLSETPYRLSALLRTSLWTRSAFLSFFFFNGTPLSFFLHTISFRQFLLNYEEYGPEAVDPAHLSLFLLRTAPFFCHTLSWLFFLSILLFTFAGFSAQLTNYINFFFCSSVQHSPNCFPFTVSSCHTSTFCAPFLAPQLSLGFNSVFLLRALGISIRSKLNLLR